MKFSSILLPFCALVAVTSCAYIIPPESNSPRANTVIGEPHRPQLNNSSMGSGLGPRSALKPSTAPAQDMTRNDAPALPPVDAATQAQAEQEMAKAQPAQITPVAVAPVAAPAVAATVSNGRRVPIENNQFQVSANDSYPSLMTVPERPALSGPDSTKERLSAVEADLQQDRAAAQASKDALARDAASEPSMLSQLPNTGASTNTGYVVPPNDPVTPPMLNAAPAKSVVVPPRDSIRSVPSQPGTSIAPATQPQAQISFKPLPSAAVTNAPVPVAEAAPRIVMPATTQTAMNVPSFAPPAPMNNASTPAARVASAPIVLMRPAENPSSGIAAQDLPAPAVNMASTPAPMVLSNPAWPNVKKGDFDPLAAADNAPITTASAATTPQTAPSTFASTGYLSASRYAARR